jgi:flagellar motility protein MotE (MotC chaperone)
MKTLIQLLMVALVVGGVSAAATIFLQPQAVPTIAAADDPHSASTDKSGEQPSGESHGDTKGADDNSPSSEASDSAADSFDSDSLAAAEPPRSTTSTSPAATLPKAASPHTGSTHGSGAIASHGSDADGGHAEARVAVRPPYTPEGDEAGALINMLRERSRAAVEAERRLAERQDAMQLIFDDLRAEQARALKIRQRLSTELKESRQAYDVAIQAIEDERVAMQKDQAEARKAAEEAVRAATEERDRLKKQLEKPNEPAAVDQGAEDSPGAVDDNANLKKMAGVFDSMPAENVAKVFEQLVKNKRTSAVVSLLNSMKDRTAAKVLAILAESNPELAADLTDRLKRLKTGSKPGAE